MKRISAKQRWLVGLSIFATLVSLLAIYDYNKLNANVTHPADLGSGLEYIGQHKFLCYFWGLSCYREAYSEYYFATDMSEDQLKTYFKGAEFQTMGTGGGGAGFNFDDLAFKATNGQKFDLQYYYGIKSSEIFPDVKNTTKSYGVSMTENDYKIAKQALQ